MTEHLKTSGSIDNRRNHTGEVNKLLREWSRASRTVQRALAEVTARSIGQTDCRSALNAPRSGRK